MEEQMIGILLKLAGLAKGKILWLCDRLDEPSSWAALATMLGFLGYNIEPGLWQHIAGVGVAVAALIGFAMREKNKKTEADGTDSAPEPHAFPVKNAGNKTGKTL